MSELAFDNPFRFLRRVKRLRAPSLEERWPARHLCSGVERAYVSMPRPTRNVALSEERDSSERAVSAPV